MTIPQPLKTLLRIMRNIVLVILAVFICVFIFLFIYGFYKSTQPAELEKSDSIPLESVTHLLGTINGVKLSIPRKYTAFGEVVYEEIKVGTKPYDASQTFNDRSFNVENQEYPIYIKAFEMKSNSFENLIYDIFLAVRIADFAGAESDETIRKAYASEYRFAIGNPLEIRSKWMHIAVQKRGAQIPELIRGYTPSI